MDNDIINAPDSAATGSAAPDAPAAVDPAEFAVAEAEAKESTGTYTHTFSRPFLVDGTPVEELTFDWAGLTAEDSLAIENELQMMGKAVIALEFSGEYLLRMAVRACTTTVNGRRVGIDAFRRMPIADYNRIRGRARSFLLRLGL